MGAREPVAAAAGLFAAYAIVFVSVGAQPVDAAGSAAINVVALAIVTAILAYAHRLSRRWPVTGWRAAAIQVFAAVAFALLWYLLVLVGFSLSTDWMHNGLAARAFGENAIVWQVFQGVTLYGLIALWLDRRTALSGQDATAHSSKPGAEPLLLKDGEEILAVDPDEIVHVAGAGDYSEIVTLHRTFLSGLTLRTLMDTLPDGFVRVHRSHIVRRAAILRAEPAGNGRLTLHLRNGDAVTTSREGARAIRQLAG